MVNGGGTLFRIDPRDSALQPFALLHAFSGPDGAQPVGGLVPGPGGALYGSAYQAGPFGKGLIFQLEPTGVTTTHAFEGPDGAHPYGSLFPAADGSLYGTASEGGTGFGTLFKIDVGGQFSQLHSFNGRNGQAPVEVMQARDGKIYGVTYRGGGPGKGGTAFRLNTDNTLETLHAFGGPGEPAKGVIETQDGSLYGTTRSSASGAGTVFKLSPARQLTVLHDFGSVAESSGLIMAADGYLYGTTEFGGAHGLGTVFRISTTGDHTVLHSFADDSVRYPQHGVTQASDGNFYGITPYGSESKLFRIDASGNFTTLRTLTQAEGFNLSGPLVEGADGSLYGTMAEGGPIGFGTAFKLTTSGDFSLLHAFDSFDNGVRPRGGLTRARDGRLYGVTSFGGADNHGILFRLETTGGITTLHHFEDVYPVTVLGGRDGALYGVASPHPVFPSPALFFRFTTGLTILYTAGHDDGVDASRLIQGSDGAFYGTVSIAQFFGGGVFRLNVSPVP